MIIRNHEKKSDQNLTDGVIEFTLHTNALTALYYICIDYHFFELLLSTVQLLIVNDIPIIIISGGKNRYETLLIDNS